MKKLCVLFNPRIEAARAFAQELESAIRTAQASAWVGSAWEEVVAREQMGGPDLVVSVGGDGTVLRSARIVSPLPIPIVGINMGHLGFMTELGADEALARLPEVVAGEGWIEERMRLGVELVAGAAEARGAEEGRGLPSALNDVMVGRGATPRVVSVEAMLDGEPLSTYKADGLIVATATGSTAYALAAGGPVLHPSIEAILLQPLAAHLNLKAPLVLPGSAVVELVVHTDHSAVLSVDGQVNVELRDSHRIRVRRSPHVTRFLRLSPPGAFYRRLAQKLGGGGNRVRF